MEKELHLRLRPSGLLLAVAYAICYLALRQLSADQWYLPAGLRVAALLLFPLRLWPYLLVGEYAAFAYLRYPKIEMYGLAWFVGASALLMPIVAYIVHKHEKLRISGRYEWFLSVAALAAVVVTALNLASTYFLMTPAGEPVSWEKALKFVIGDYLGILILGPLAILWKQRRLPYASSRKLRWDAFVGVSIIALLSVYLVQFSSSDILQKNSIRILMVLPAIALTCLHGWRGAAIGVIAVNLAIGLTVNGGEARDYTNYAEAFIVQEILAVAGTALLWFGSTISHHYRKFTSQRQVEKQAMSIARTSILSTEREMRERAIRMKIIGEDMDISFRKAVQWLQGRGHHAAAMDMLRTSVIQSRLFREQLSLVYPSEIEHYGLYLVLESSAIAEVWDQTGRLATPRLKGDPCQLGLGLQLAAYRSISDAVALLLEQESGSILVRARCGRRGGYRGIVVSVSLLDNSRTLGEEISERAAEALSGRALAYGGSVRCRRNRICLLLAEPARAERAAYATAMPGVSAAQQAQATPLAPM
ncbi:MASE1 domain-containing protein [Luteimonas aquatica]|uniref:MASE1 domain-containing protein n=1 Tax=Luteimonas aquatica TaxID=450364 RepID=UPI001F57970A|nr:MASE1 domain-containing protein [Luteimonas aquatica]